MTVYIVWFNNFHSVDEFNGVFSSEGTAQAYIDKVCKSEHSQFRIEATQLDDY